MPKCSDGKIALVALIAFAAWLFVGLPFLYSPSQEHVHGELLGVKYGEWLLFAATAVLALSTWLLVKGAEKNAERQLRAYVYVEKTKFTFDNGTWDWAHSYQIKNFGQTPAHHVRVVSRSEVVDWSDGHPQIPKPTDALSLGSMAPYGDFFENDCSINGVPTIQELNSETKAIFLVGTITYSTIFGGPERVTNFRYYVGGDMKYVGGEMYAYDDGNDAT